MYYEWLGLVKERLSWYREYASGRKRKALSDLAKNLLGVSETICDGRVGPSRGCAWTHPEDNLASQGFYLGVEGGWKKQEGVCGSFCKSNEVVVWKKAGTCRTTCSHKDYILSLHSFFVTLANYNLESVNWPNPKNYHGPQDQEVAFDRSASFIIAMIGITKRLT